MKNKQLVQIRISSDKERRGIILGCYSEELETEMLKFYDSLHEKDQRRYAAIEAKKVIAQPRKSDKKAKADKLRI